MHDEPKALAVCLIQASVGAIITDMIVSITRCDKLRTSAIDSIPSKRSSQLSPKKGGTSYFTGMASKKHSYVSTIQSRVGATVVNIRVFKRSHKTKKPAEESISSSKQHSALRGRLKRHEPQRPTVSLNANPNS